MEKVTRWWKLDVNLIKSVDHENEVNVRWHMPDWNVHTMINMWIKYKMYDEPTLHGSGESDLSMKNLHKFNNASRL